LLFFAGRDHERDRVGPRRDIAGIRRHREHDIALGGEVRPQRAERLAVLNDDEAWSKLCCRGQAGRAAQVLISRVLAHAGDESEYLGATISIPMKGRVRAGLVNAYLAITYAPVSIWPL